MNSDSKKNLNKVGHVKESRSLQGEVWIHLYSGEAPWASELKKVSLQKPDSEDFLEYVVSSFKVQNDKFLLKLKNVNDRDAADALKGHVVWIDSKLLETKVGESFYLRELVGFTVVEKEIALGLVTAIETNGAQDILVVDVERDGKMHPVLIPLVKDFIVKIDHVEKIIAMNLPVGLVEANLAF